MGQKVHWTGLKFISETDNYMLLRMEYIFKWQKYNTGGTAIKQN